MIPPEALTDVIRLAEGPPPKAEDYRWDGMDLTLVVPTRESPVALECQCGRRHWLVAETGALSSTVLRIRCHGCGRSWSIAIGGARRLAGP